MRLFRKILDIILWPYTYVRDERRFRKRMKELQKRDPFIYK